ncbi:alpha/beta hydrolase [Algivirga pacifica]|uniref:Alpha/beta hydrolase n=1 Tax=Algivirga pacifica TaxID=1162670 RepID=A0ABP9DF69_9BACT
MGKRNTYSVGGNTLSVIEMGDSADPVAIFLHGIPASAELWRSSMSRIAQDGWYCMAPDLPGFGQTEIKVKDPSAYTLEGMAKLLLQWMMQEGLGEVWLISHDIGGGVAQWMLSEKPLLFTKATFSNSIAGDSWPVKDVAPMIKAAKTKMFAWMALLGFFKKKDLHRAIAKTFRQQPIEMDEFECIFYDGKFSNFQRAKKFQKMLRSLDNKYTQEILGKLSLVNVPVQLVWAMDDIYQPWGISGVMLKEAFPKATVTQIHNCGHFLQIDDVDSYTEALLR